MGAATDVVPRFTPDVDAPTIVQALRGTGAAIVDGFLDASEVAAIRAELDPVIAATPLGRNDFEGFGTQRVYALFAKVRCFDALAIHPLLLGVLDAVLGSYQLSAPVAINIGPNHPAQGFHRDDSVYPLHWPHEPVVLNTMWALDDFTDENGATRLLPGSHTEPMPMPVPEERAINATMRAGSMMFYVGTLVHSGGANRTDAPRLGVILEYVASWLRAQENHVLAVPREVVRTLPERLQELLGYNVHPPFLGYVDGRHPRRALQ